MTLVRIFVFFLGSLAMSAVAYRLEHHQVDILEFSGNETGKDLWRFEEKVDGQLPGVCWACKWIVNKVKESLPRDNSETQNEIKNKLLLVCDNIGFLRFLCKAFLSKSLDVLVEELSTTDSANTICINVQACSKSTVEDIEEPVWRNKIQ